VQEQTRSGANGATGQNKSGPFANDNLGSVEWAMETFPSPRTPPTPPAYPILSARRENKMAEAGTADCCGLPVAFSLLLLPWAQTRHDLQQALPILN